ncbi:glycosyl transferase family protein [Geobacter metallireducens RCH3]|uniref:Membrane protein, putative n=1 Tax=Geobacter metallireducens (strain ATCC 53774 / DSM 7210 / GS-15) TaxID=269799 RepID=Q39T18_GEOMG|nr:glycosyltransferase family 39 protein [Geobacter metallireducens]ABB32606.1 membrane protein, putative [Geobacter metallireducens GS-15]EHP83861.1 glycosyl transferase family protein [Geobacter metallireducens RCH3]
MKTIVPLKEVVKKGTPEATVEAVRTPGVWWVVILCVAWVVPGLVGHDPWKADEPYTFGLVNHILRTGDWVVPTLAGEPFLEKPPLFFITAAGFARLFSPLMPLHDAARLAAGFYSLVALLFAGLSGRELFGKGKGRIAALLVLGCIGLQPTAHKLITDTALFAGFSVALYGLALCSRRHLTGGFLLGTGTGMGFMAKGLLAPGLLGLIAMALPLAASEWRSRRYAVTLAVALVAAAPWFVVWPYALYLKAPHLFDEWLWVQNFGRFLGHNDLGPKNKPGFYLYTLPWYAWPALPLAIPSVVKERSWRRSGSPLLLPLTAFVVMLAVLSLSRDARGLYALPMLLPLGFLAVRGEELLNGRFARGLNSAAVVIPTVAALLLWGGWLAMTTGVPAVVSDAILRRHPHDPVVRPFLVVTALLYTVAWGVAVWRCRRIGPRFSVIWGAGMVMVWGVVMTLWLPWQDAGKSYRGVAASLVQAMSPHACISSRGLGESERAMFEYLAGIVTKRVEVGAPVGCTLHLDQLRSEPKDSPPAAGWVKVWEGRRPGSNDERFVLWRRGDIPGRSRVSAGP